jgi:Flp pilus assembly pilin Flp
MIEMKLRLTRALSRALSRARGEKGQNTVEYLLLLSVIVAGALIVGVAIKKYLPNLFNQISQSISGAAGNLANPNGG